MKTFSISMLALFISLALTAQIEFTWGSQYISEGNNMKDMNIVNDTMTILAGYGRTFAVSADKGITWDDVPVLDPIFDFGDLSINSSGVGYALSGDVKLIDNPTGSIEHDVAAEGVLLKTMEYPVIVNIFGMSY